MLIMATPHVVADVGTPRQGWCSWICNYFRKPPKEMQINKATVFILQEVDSLREVLEQVEEQVNRYQALAKQLKDRIEALQPLVFKSHEKLKTDQTFLAIIQPKIAEANQQKAQARREAEAAFQLLRQRPSHVPYNAQQFTGLDTSEASAPWATP